MKHIVGKQRRHEQVRKLRGQWVLVAVDKRRHGAEHLVHGRHDVTTDDPFDFRTFDTQEEAEGYKREHLSSLTRYYARFLFLPIQL